MPKDNKLISALSMAVIRKFIDMSAVEYYRQNRAELYALLDRANYRFDCESQRWVERKFKKRRSARIKVTERHGGDIALVRIIAPSSQIDYIISQMNELLPCLNAEITSISKRYPGSGTWDRVYLRVKFNGGDHV